MILPMAQVVDEVEARHRRKGAIGMACALEAAVMALLISVALAVFLWLTSFAMSQSDGARRIAEATAMAETTMEDALANSIDDIDENIVVTTDEGRDLAVSCLMTERRREAGRMVHIEVSVRRLSDDEELCSLETDRYMADGIASPIQTTSVTNMTDTQGGDMA